MPPIPTDVKLNTLAVLWHHEALNRNSACTTTLRQMPLQTRTPIGDLLTRAFEGPALELKPGALSAKPVTTQELEAIRRQGKGRPS